MKNSSIIFLCLMLLLSVFTNAQPYQGTSNAFNSAFNFSQNNISGTARTLGFGGGQSALGEDVSCIGINPAGLGLILNSEFSISPTLRFARAKSSFLDNTYTTPKDNLNANNFGVVLASGENEEKKIKNYTLGFSYSRKNNYHEKFYYKAINPYNSMTRSFAEGALGLGVEDFSSVPIDSLTSYTELAFQSFLILDGDSDDIYNTPLVNGGGLLQEEEVLTTGSKNQWDFAFGLNFNDKIYIGGSFGIVGVNNHKKHTYREEDVQDSVAYLEKYILLDEIKTTGTGFNFTLGTIIKPNEWLNIGLTVQTPTAFSIRESWSAIVKDIELDDDYPNKPLSIQKEYSTLTSITEYKMTSPLKTSLGAVFKIKKKALLSFDVDYSNMSATRLKSKQSAWTTTSTDFTTANSKIDSAFKSTFNFRIGAEYNFDVLSFRTGFALNGDPFKNNNTLNGQKKFLTFGIGYHKNEFFMDLAFVREVYAHTYSPYTLMSGNDPSVLINNKTTKIVSTLGFQF